MAKITYSANLKAATFPLRSDLSGRTVIVKGQDQNYIPGLAAKESLDAAIGVPQIYFAQNVIPTNEGYASVGYLPRSEQIGVDFDHNCQIVTLRDDQGNVTLMAMDPSGNLYMMPKENQTWRAIQQPPALLLAGKPITTAYIAGVTYMHWANMLQLFSYVHLGPDLPGYWGPVTHGINWQDILGIAAVAGYLIAYSEYGIAWGSLLNPLDFVPDLATGAGGGQVEGLEGKIVRIVPVIGGMIIFAEGNAVAGIATGNPRYPFNFVPISGCGGLADFSHVAESTGEGTVYAYTKFGLQTVTLRGAAIAMAEVTDFISEGRYEYFNPVTKEIVEAPAVSTEFVKKLALISGRYLILSYGDNLLDQAIYFDIQLKQTGKLVVDHVAFFEMPFESNDDLTYDIPKSSIAVLGTAGRIRTLHVGTWSGGAKEMPVIILGKFQYARSRLTQLQAVTLENTPGLVTVYDLPTLDGKTYLPAIEGYALPNTGLVSKFQFHNTALNHSIVVQGYFTLVSLILEFNVAGAR